LTCKDVPTSCETVFSTELNRSNRSYSTKYKIILVGTGRTWCSGVVPPAPWKHRWVNWTEL